MGRRHRARRQPGRFPLSVDPSARKPLYLVRKSDRRAEKRCRPRSNHGVGRKGRQSGWIRPGQTVVLGDMEGPGVIRHIWLTTKEVPTIAGGGAEGDAGLCRGRQQAGFSYMR